MTAPNPREQALARAHAAIDAAAPLAAADPRRPRFHFCPPAQWMNDPNGTLFHDGWHHLFYQSNPYSDQWNHMHWGHARSRDLVRWEHLPIALWPSVEAGENHCYSGCITVTDTGKPKIFYTSIGSSRPARDVAQQWAATSDDWVHWHKHPANPFLENSVHRPAHVLEWRDPFVFRHGERTLMTIGGKLEACDGGDAVVLLYESRDAELDHWAYRGVLFRHPDPNLFSVECPNFFPLGGRHVLLHSPYAPVEWLTGQFEAGTPRFTPTRTGRLEETGAFYATNVFLGDPRRTVVIGWIGRHGFFRGAGWNGCQSIPRVLDLNAEGRLLQSPIPELESLRGEPTHRARIDLSGTPTALDSAAPPGFELEATVEPPASGEAVLTLSIGGREPFATVAIGATRVRVQSCVSDRVIPGGPVSLRLFLDRSVLEVFVDGRQSFSSVVGHADEPVRVSWRSESAATARDVTLWPMREA